VRKTGNGRNGTVVRCTQTTLYSRAMALIIALEGAR